MTNLPAGGDAGNLPPSHDRVERLTARPVPEVVHHPPYGPDLDCDRPYEEALAQRDQALPELPGGEYADSGDWPPAVSDLIRWLGTNACHEHAYRLERQVQAWRTAGLRWAPAPYLRFHLLDGQLQVAPAPGAPGGSAAESRAEEAAVLSAIQEALARLYNQPPRHLTREQTRELSGLRRRAIQCVGYRL